MRLLTRSLLSALFFSLATVVGAQGVSLTPIEIKEILKHGPWPMAPRQDPGNEFSAKPAARRLGQQLFFDPRLSANTRVACVSCHHPALGFADGRAKSIAFVPSETLDRNSPSLWNAVYERWYGWDGASDSLWSQSLRPLLDPREMAGSLDLIQGLMMTDRRLSEGYELAFGHAPKDKSAQIVAVNTSKALGAFMAGLVSPATPFDGLVKTLANNEPWEVSQYPVPALRGLKIFVGKGNCNLCHLGPMFSNGEFADTGIPFFIRPGVVDKARHGGIQALRSSEYNLLSKFSTADQNEQRKTRHVELQHRNFGEFKVPSLRNVADTGPYMHNGSLPTLEAVVSHYSNLNLERLHADGEQILKPLRLSDAEQADLVAFLRTLSPPPRRRQP
jgi:cytochrome c peroxidase